MAKKKELEVTGSLLQDVSIPEVEDMDGAVDLFLGGSLPNAATVSDPSDKEVNDFLRGK